MPLEDWFDRYQYEIDYDVGESGVKYLKLKKLDIDIEDLDLRYGHHIGSPELRQLISEMYEGAGPDNIAVTTGSSESNFALIASLVGDSDHMIVEHPNYCSLYEVARSLERKHDLFPLSFHERFVPDLTRLASLLKPNTKLITMTHPNNPTGSVIEEKQLREVVSMAEKNDAYLLHDETYRELTFERPPPPAATLSDHAISMTTMSKSFGLPGVRIGWVVGPKHIVEGVRKVREQITICNNSIGEAIAYQVFKKKDSILSKVRQTVKQNLDILREWMTRQQSLEWVEPKGGVVAFPRLKNANDTEELCRLLVKRYRTFTIPGYCFEMNQHVRIGFGGEELELRAGLERVGKAIHDIENESTSTVMKKRTA